MQNEMEKVIDIKELIKALEVCLSSNKGCSQCPYDDECGFDAHFMKGMCLRALKQYEEINNHKDNKILSLEKALEEQKNGYEQTLYLERCKIHDLEEKLSTMKPTLPKERYNIYYHKYSIMANDYIQYIKVVYTDDIYHEIGKMISQSLEHIKRIRWTNPKASIEECEKLWRGDGYEPIGNLGVWWNTKEPAPK